MREMSRKLNIADKPRKRRAAWKRVVSAMAMVVVFCTVYALVLPAITLSEEPICGQEAHEHTDECYRSEILVAQCPAAAHVHDASCQGTLENPACGFGEQILHTHADNCYDQLGKLICELPELQEHLHDDACAPTEQTLICQLQEAEGHVHSAECTAEAELICQLTETPGHTHGEGCYEEQTVLTCQEQEVQPHAHAEECYGLSEEPICGQEHDHEAACYEKVLTCTVEETEGHVHTDGCYRLEQTLICTETEAEAHTHGEGCWSEAKTCALEEAEGHIHSEECYETKQSGTCQIQQVADHVHTESCFDGEGQRICGLISGVKHVHDETCFKVIRLDTPELICQQPVHIHVDACYLDPGDLPPSKKDFYCDKGVHAHGDDCYNTAGELTCNILEHSHDVSCKVPHYDPEADVETEKDWEATVKDVNLSGRWPADLMAVAGTQLGYRESKQNVVWNEDDSVKGYSRYGAWYGAPYMDWSAAFVSFCINYAKVDALPQDSSCASYYEKLEIAGLLRSPKNYMPKPGDIVLLDTLPEDEEAKPDQMGIVAELLINEAGELSILKVMQGDASDEVKYLTYDLISNRILAYGETPMGETKVLLCDQEHEHASDCYGFKLYYTDDTMHAQVLIQGLEELPVDVTLVVNRITSASDPAGYGSMIHALSTRMQESPYYMGDASFYQMELFRGGDPYPLPEGAKTSVDVSFTAPVFTPEAMEGAAKVETFLLTPNETQENPGSLEISGTISSSMTQAMGGGQASEAPEDSEEETSEPVYDTYQVEQVEEDTYENASGGLTGVGFISDRQLATFAVVLSNTTKEGQFWERVFSVDEITSGGTYMIVSAEGNFALRGNENNNYTAVTIQAQKGEEDPDADWGANPERNTRYYTITQRNGTPVDNNVYWTFTGSGNKYTVRNQATAIYLALSRLRTGGTFIPRYTEYFMHTEAAELTLTYVTPENVWRISNYSDLRNAGTGAFAKRASSGNDSSNMYYDDQVTYRFTEDMLIFKLSDVTSLEIPKDVVDVASGSGGSAEAPEKPDYGAFIVPSDSKTGETAVVNGSTSINGLYFSDPSTANIESQFRQDSFEASSLIDGKVVTDKSVIYGADDYAAFQSYDPNTFSVTLSALGQDYEIPYQYMVKTPVDVVFVLDVSGSMSSTKAEGGTNPDRVIDLRNAVNKAMATIFADHEANRVGISVYSSGAWEMLPLGRYTANDNQYLVTNEKTYTHSPSDLSLGINFLQGAPSLKSEDGTSYAGVGSNWNQGVGTYTQAGIAMGNEIFEAIGDDTTYTTTIGEGENARPYTVTRQPVYILVSDGEPTHSTSVYNDVLKGPHYGNGLSGSTNGKGIHGYYTILSANYYKRAVSIQYNTPALFYSIGMGIHATADGPLTASSSTGDNYKRAVLNPQQDIIENLTADLAKEITVDQLKAMLQNTYPDATVEVDPDFPEDWYGVPHRYEPVLQPNPYTDDYTYTDGAYFGDLPEEELSKIFQEIYQSSIHVTPYGFVLFRNSSVNIMDNIGSGMEIKGTPVLRYCGTNYSDPQVIESGNSVIYVYNATVTDPYIPNRVTDLSEITVTVTTNEDGTQTVYMYVQDTALPTYTPELIGQKYYYEQLPVRLIYQVGLTEEAEADVLALGQTGGELVYYTNKWSEEDISTSTLLPSDVNPFYYRSDGTEAPYKPHHSLKSEDTTTTVDYHVDCQRDIENIAGQVLVEVIHKQGNNGKLVFNAETIELPVEKQWDAGVDPELMDFVTMKLYMVTEHVDEYGDLIRTATPVSYLTLSNDNDWADRFTGLRKPDESWYYVVAEVVPSGFTAGYNGETVTVTTDGENFFQAVKIEDFETTVTVTNLVSVQLPTTGGGGTHWYTLGGILLILTATLLWYSFYLIRRREESPSP